MELDRRMLCGLFQDLAVTVLCDEPLARHTTWRIGGSADAMVIVETVEQAQSVLAAARRAAIPVFVLGRGSNLLVRDGGIRGLVIKLGEGLSEVSRDGDRVTALAGKGMVSTANIAIQNGLSGLEFATGIPGSVGGAVTMNAGAHGSEIKDALLAATVLTADGELLAVPAADMGFAYRHSVVREREWTVLSATFALHPGDRDEMRERVYAWRRRRQATQPLSLPNCGSVFRNPPGDYAARLVEAAGLKGVRIGNAAISELHANFIVNLGGARAVDVLQLMERAAAEVWERFGVRLIPEVRLVGEDEARG